MLEGANSKIRLVHLPGLKYWRSIYKSNFLIESVWIKVLILLHHHVARSIQFSIGGVGDILGKVIKKGGADATLDALVTYLYRGNHHDENLTYFKYKYCCCKLKANASYFLFFIYKQSVFNIAWIHVEHPIFFEKLTNGVPVSRSFYLFLEWFYYFIIPFNKPFISTIDKHTWEEFLIPFDIGGKYFKLFDLMVVC